MGNKRTIQQVYRRWQTGQNPPTNSPGTPRLTGEYGSSPRVRPLDSPIASPRPTRIQATHRWVSFGRAPAPNWQSRQHFVYSNRPVTRIRGSPGRHDSARTWSTPDSTPAPTESEGEVVGRMQAFEIESPIAVSESTSMAFSTAFVEFVAVGLFFHFYNKVVPRGRDPADWNRRVMDWIDKYIRHKPQAAPPRTVITGTSQPKASCLPGFPNMFTSPGPSPIAAS